MCSNENMGHELPADLDPASWAWLPGVDCLTGWKGAREIAWRLNAALSGVGLPAEQMDACAGSLADGRGVVKLAGTPQAAMWLAVLLESIATEHAEESPGEGAA
ncbi:hypothetical protein [Phaeacidiphilus oryzae]|uniref:hypothetical protein n=1 Tax=Phaeacidiphilus oryzae TaxID=348818 RepID=UPI0007C6A133|nr:hypothetical protein [Phaeacidiphilus oryzae]